MTDARIVPKDDLHREVLERRAVRWLKYRTDDAALRFAEDELEDDCEDFLAS